MTKPRAKLSVTVLGLGVRLAHKPGWQDLATPLKPDSRLTDPAKIQADQEKKRKELEHIALTTPCLSTITDFELIDSRNRCIASWDQHVDGKNAAAMLINTLRYLRSESHGCFVFGFDICDVLRIAVADALRHIDERRSIPYWILRPAESRSFFDPYHLLLPTAKNRDVVSLSACCKALDIDITKYDLTKVRDEARLVMAMVEAMRLDIVSWVDAIGMDRRLVISGREELHDDD